MSAVRRPCLTFEPLTEGHIGALMEIELEAYPEPWTWGMFQEEARSPRSYFCLVHLGAELMGYGGFWLAADEAHLTSVTIRHEYRGRGYGRALLEHLLSAAVERGATTATLEVRQSNHRAQNLYRSMGFRSVRVRAKYYSKTNEDAVVMLKVLEPAKSNSGQEPAGCA